MALPLSRFFRHLFAPAVARMFPAVALQRIAAAIAEGESTHGGEVCFAVEPALPSRRVLAGIDARARALEAFAQLRVWDTRANNGVLLYLLLADQRIELVADRGLAGLVDGDQWREVCSAMEARLAGGDGEAAVVDGIARVSALLALHFPPGTGAAEDNELPDQPHVF